MNKREKREKILIVGSGAMACLFAGRLAASGTAVRLLGTWPEGLEALRRWGVRLRQGEALEAYPVEVAEGAEDCAGIRYALVLVKSWQTEAAARRLALCLPVDGLALTLQNGLGNAEILAEFLGPRRVAVGATTAAAYLEAPGIVRPIGEGEVMLAEAQSRRLRALIEALQRAGFGVQGMADIRSAQWGKLAINAAINPLTALLRLPNGALLERPSVRQLMGEAAREVGAVARALGIRLPYPDPAAAAEAVARRTAENRSSMLQDVLRQAPTEIEAICGAVVRRGEAAGVATPVNRILWQLVKGLEGK